MRVGRVTVHVCIHLDQGEMLILCPGLSTGDKATALAPFEGTFRPIRLSQCCWEFLHDICNAVCKVWLLGCKVAIRWLLSVG